MAAEYLLSVGFPHYAMCAHGAYEFSTLRSGAFIQRMKEAGNTVNEIDTAKDPLAPWLAALPKPVAVFCCNDAWAHRVLSAARSSRRARAR